MNNLPSINADGAFVGDLPLFITGAVIIFIAALVGFVTKNFIGNLLSLLLMIGGALLVLSSIELGQYRSIITTGVTITLFLLGSINMIAASKQKEKRIYGLNFFFGLIGILIGAFAAFQYVTFYFGFDNPVTTALSSAIDEVKAIFGMASSGWRDFNQR